MIAFLLDLFGRVDAKALLETELGRLGPGSCGSRWAENQRARINKRICLVFALRCTRSTPVPD